MINKQKKVFLFIFIEYFCKKKIFKKFLFLFIFMDFLFIFSDLIGAGTLCLFLLKNYL